MNNEKNRFTSAALLLIYSVAGCATSPSASMDYVNEKIHDLNLRLGGRINDLNTTVNKQNAQINEMKKEQLEQIKEIQSLTTRLSLTLKATDWAAACTTGSPVNAPGCYGNINSPGFTKINDKIGGFTTYANINPTNAPEGSVFIKAFPAGTNTPIDSKYISFNITANAARCALFTQQGLGVGPEGISSNNPANGTADSGINPPHTAVISTFNNVLVPQAFLYNWDGSDASAVHVPKPIYLVCAGYNSSDGSTASSLTGSISAT